MTVAGSGIARKKHAPPREGADQGGPPPAEGRTMANTITVRHRIGGTLPFPPFSARNFRDLSGGAPGPTPPPGFADTAVPVTGASLAQCVYLSGLFVPPALCSGLGRCGLCRVRFLSAPPPALDAEKTVLSLHDLDAGWRLACRHAPEKGAHILTPAPLLQRAREEAARGAETREGRFALAVDLGTTSIHWRVVPLDGRTGGPDLPHGIMTNPQMGAGSDVISRIAYAAREGGTETLGRLVRAALADTVTAARAGGFRIEALCVAANPAMTGIFLGCDTRSLARAPYALPCPGNREAAVAGLPAAYIPPLIAPFVGGDVSAGYAALALDPAVPAPEYPFLLADLGTNGECVLALSPRQALAASLPMGPALEGISLAFGSEAVAGAVTEYALTPRGLDPIVMGGGSPTGITATGYLSLLRILLASNVLSEDGLFAPRGGAPLARKLGGEEWEGIGEKSIRLPGKMALFASDVEEILKVKAAFTLALSRLLREASLPPTRLSRICLAGSLGMNVPVAALTGLGFVPPGTGNTVVPAGNTSLAGAALFLGNKAAREKCARWAESVITLDLAADTAFGEDFARHMAFAWRS
jgi:uncharacterized 2Fe-2S/4Fe-4S cluster protein (DUF4445 family)